MYNSTTESKIRNIPKIGDIDVDRLPQTLTKIYAQIVSIRKQISEGALSYHDGTMDVECDLLIKLSINLETILLVHPNHDKKESIAFVAATANNLLHKIKVASIDSKSIFEIDSISSFISAVILFLIGNSQPDAAEMVNNFTQFNVPNKIHRWLFDNICALGTGKLEEISNIDFTNDEIINYDDIQETALNFLWKELGLGVLNISENLKGKTLAQQENYFSKVIDLSKSSDKLFDQKSVFAGPYRLAKLLQILEGDILSRAVTSIPAPPSLDKYVWTSFLENLAKDRPYLWENHMDAVAKGILNVGTSSVITLPTGAGKSTLSELKIASCVYSGKKVVYLVPTHALEDQVNRNLKKLFSDFEVSNINIDKEYSDSQGIDNKLILVMTPERCLTLINTEPDWFMSVGLVIFDEFHLIHGIDLKKDPRAIDAMYCLISLFTNIPNADYMLISAMVENGNEIREWVSKITNRSCLLFNSTWKPTRQLHGCIVYESDVISALKKTVLQEQKAKKTRGPSTKLKKNMSVTPECFFSMKNIWETADDNDYFRTKFTIEKMLLGLNSNWKLTSNRNQIAAQIAIHFSKIGLKTLVFVDTPTFANSTSKVISNGIKDNSNCFDEYLKKHEKLIKSLSLELGDISHSYFNGCENVGVHHGLLLPTERNLIEQYFKEPNGAMALVATATLAQGINLPAEIVIIAGDDRYDEDGGGRETVLAHELLNAAGRAGRAGQSAQGAVILIPGDIVTIRDLTISKRWWQLKEEIFSKGDQCLVIEDPLEYFLDSLQVNSQKLESSQINVLYRFKAGTSSENETRKMLKNSFYNYKSGKLANEDKFDAQVDLLLAMKSEMDQNSEEPDWARELGFKTGVDSFIIIELGNALEEYTLENLFSFSIVEYIRWFLNWLNSNETYLRMIFVKEGTISNIKRTVGIHSDENCTVKSITSRFHILENILLNYVQGKPLSVIEASIPGINQSEITPFLKKARNFTLKLIPDLSIAFGLVSLIIVEKAKHKGISKTDLPKEITNLASCVKEGFDSIEKLNLKKKSFGLMRVEIHSIFALDK